MRHLLSFGIIVAVGLAAPAVAHAQATRSLSGIVVDSDTNKPIAHASVVVKDATAQAAPAALLTTGDDGAFNLAKVPVKDLIIDVTAPDYDEITLPVKAGKAAASVAIALRHKQAAAPPPPQALRTVAGLVKDSRTDKPIAGATVAVVGGTQTTTTDADGLFTLTGVPASDVSLSFTADGYSPGQADIISDEASTKIALEPTTAAPPPTPTTRALRGKLTEKLTGDPVVGATITVVGTTNAVFSDEKGEFQFDNLPLEQATLSVEADGYKAIQITALPTSTEVLGVMEFVGGTEEIVLEARAPVIVRQNLANGASVVKDEDLNRISAQTVESAMVGKVSGANLQSNSGAPGGGMQLRLRGISTINGQSSPLYVIDGVIISNVAVPSGINAITAAQAGGNTSNQDNPVNRVADLNPNDIETVEVLKGASAAALYGSKAANGVVIITTKRGKAGKTRVSFTQRVGMSQIENTLGSRQFTSADEVMQAFGPDVVPFYTGATYDHEKELTQQKVATETIASASGGNDKGTYYGSLLVRNEPGIITRTGYDKQSGRIGITYDFGDRLKLSLGTSLLHSTADRGLTNNDNTGTSYYVALSSTPSFIDLNAMPNGRFPDNPLASSNPLQTVALFTADEEVWRLIGSANAGLRLHKDDHSEVTALATYGVDRFSQRDHIYSPAELQFEAGDDQPGALVEGQTGNLNWNLSAGVLWKYKPESAKWKSALSAGLTYESTDLLSVYTRGDTVSQESIATATSVRTQQTALRTHDQGVYAQEEVSAMDDRLSVLAGVLGERSSLNGNSDHFFVFPKVAAVYELEVPKKTFDLVRVRGALGQAGNRPNYGQKFTGLDPTQTIQGLPSLSVVGTLGDPDIKPERQTEVELGVDVATKDQRAVLELTGYQRNISDLLLQQALGPSSGFTTKFVNSGSMRNRGLEAALQVTPVDKQVTWVTRALLTLNRSTITSLPGGAFNITTVGFGAGLGTFRIEKGHSATQIVDDYDGDGTLNVVGDGEPDFRVGWSNNVTWKRFGFTSLIDWQQGSDIINLTRLLYDFGQVSPDYVGAGEARLAAFSAGDMRPYIEDATFVKLREISVYWDMPDKWAKQIGPVETLRLSISGRNLHTWTGYSGLDPEVSNFGNQPVGRNFDVAPYPPSRSVWLSLEAGM